MCFYPYTIKSKDAFGNPCLQTVPCGKCIECMKDKQNAWKIRLVEESRDHRYVYFFTLTYNEDSVPFVRHEGEKINVVSKNDVQLWVKRNRMAYQRLFNREVDFKYFICSEYGPNTGRPHYHGILFTDVSPTFISSMFHDWSCNYGFVNFSEVGKKCSKSTRSSASAVGNYVAKYCAKPMAFKSDVELRLGELMRECIIPSPFYLMSKGIGASYLQRMRRYHLPFIRDKKARVSTICDRAFYHDASFKYKLPRYYRDRLYRKKFPFETKVWNLKLKLYEEKIVYRYASKNLLSLQMQSEIRSRILADYNRRVKELSAQYPSLSRAEIDSLISRAEKSSVLSRKENCYRKMSKFYNSAKSKTPKF